MEETLVSSASQSYALVHSTIKESNMNRFLSSAAVAAFLSFSLAACGGGGGGDSTQASTTPPPATTGVGAGGTGSTTSTPVSGGTGTKVTVGDPSAPSDPWVNPNPIPNCTPKPVMIALQGDTIMTDYFNTGRLQALMDAQYGPGSTSVLNYALGGNDSGSYLYITGDIVVANFGVWDMMDRIPVAQYLHNMTAIAPTLVVLQTPVDTRQNVDPVPFMDAAKSLGVPVADAYSYVNSLITDQTPLNTLLSDGRHPTADVDKLIIENVIAPAVAKQVAPMRCVQL
jgi:hypothetical protein